MSKKKIEIGEIVFHVVSTVLIIAVLIMTVYPFIYMVMLSLSSGGTYGKALLWPSNFSLTAYDLMINKVKFLSGAKISLSRAIFGPLCTLVVIYMGAYVLSFRRVMGHKFFNRFVVFSMYFSAGLLPVYLNISNLNLIGSYWVYILPYLCSAYELILIRTYIQSIPRGLEEAALIDGANDVCIAFSIVLPLCVPVLAAVALFEFVNQWNMYTDTMLYNAHQSHLHTLQYSLSNYLAKQMSFSPTDFVDKAAQQNFNLDSLRMAMTIVTCIPILIVYPFLQRYFIKGIMVGSIKG